MEIDKTPKDINVKFEELDDKLASLQDLILKMKVDFDFIARDQNKSTIYVHIVKTTEDLLNNLLLILDKNKTTEKECDIYNITGEDLLEILIGIQIQFDTPYITHNWLCECQYHKEESDRLANEVNIDLNSISYKSIEDNDNQLKEFFADLFSQMTDAQFKDYLYIKG